MDFTSDYFTGDDKIPVKKVAEASESGPAFTILSGISCGPFSPLPSLAGIGAASLLAYKICEPLGESYPVMGISMAAIGMLSIVGMIMSNDAYGPIVDNAQWISRNVRFRDEVLEITDQLGCSRKHL